MLATRLWRARRRLSAVLLLATGLSLMAAPVAADPRGDVNKAKQALQNAQSYAHAADSALGAARAALAAANAQLAALEQRIAVLDARVAADSATYRQVQAEVNADKARLSAYLRHTYESGGSEAALVYIVSANDIAGAIQRKVQIDSIATASQNLVARIHREADRAAKTLADDNESRAQLATAEAQARTTRVLVAVQEQQVQQVATAAHQQATAAKSALNQANAALAAWLLAAQQKGTIFSCIPGPTFTVDTCLTLPSGETAAKIDSFLQGTAMAGLGDSFMRAEQTLHVSARYFVAHAILESAWGASAIAQDKHNLFGFNADDRNPYQDATTFSSFDACIQYVAQFVAVNYLSANGRYYLGPTLRGMNVKYVSDPNWATKIASIADTLP